MAAMPNQALIVKCPACGAEPGYPCTTISSYHMTEAHTKRKALAGKKPPQSALQSAGQKGNEANRQA